MVPYLTKQTQRTIVMCSIDWSLIGMKQVLNAIHQHSEKRIDIHCKVTFGFKYIKQYLGCIYTKTQLYISASEGLGSNARYKDFRWMTSARQSREERYLPIDFDFNRYLPFKVLSNYSDLNIWEFSQLFHVRYNMHNNLCWKMSNTKAV